MTMIELGKITEIRTGRLNANQAIEDGKYPFFTCSVNPLRIDDYAYDCECVLVAGNGDLNVKYYNGKFNAYQRVYIVESIDKSKYDVKFLYYFLQTHIDTLRRNSIGGVIKYIRLGDLTNAEVPNFTIETQRKIVSVIEKSEKALVLRKQQTEALSALKQSVFFDMFDTVSTNKYNFKIDILGNYTTLVTSGSTPRGGAKSYLDEGIPLIRSQNVLWNEFDISDVAYIAEEMHESMRRSQLNNKDVLFNITGASIGRCSVYEGDNNSANVNQHVCIIRLNDKINPYYLSYFLTGIEFQKNVVSKNIGATRQAFNYTQIKNFNLLIPDISLQNEFEAKVKQIDASISSTKESLMQLNSLSDTLLHKAFNGELFKEEIKA